MSEPGTAELALHVWDGLRTLVLESGERRREVSEALGMSFFRTKALRRLARNPMTLRELAAALQSDAPYTTLVVDDLEARELVTRTPHPDDRRRKLVSVTPAGLQAAREAEQILGTPPATMQALSASDLVELDRLVTLLLGADGSR
jgi:DNA-binding MarR family transcriptional regulator